jgi:hypothetical protein
MATIRLIHGFLHEKQTAQPEWGSITINEVVLVETDSPIYNQIDLLNALPAAPNTVTATNPKGISFTFDVSEHPDSSALILRSSGVIKQANESGTFWEVPLTYKTFSIMEATGAAIAGSNTYPKKRKDQRQVQNPINRPVVWNSSTSPMEKDTYLHANGLDPIVHANLLPITKPFRYEEIHETHTFSYNINYDDFNYATQYRPYIGKVDSSGIFGSTPKTFKLVSATYSEEYESLQTSGGTEATKTEYHYVRVTLTFELNPTGWDIDAQVVSMSTLQIVTIGKYEKIKVSATQYATEPWPLLASGQGAPYDAIDPADFAYVDHGYPKLADLSVVVAYKGLTIP